jgi:dTDP-4-amino-4,6-dideoxygalactose transaminase
MKVPFLDLKMQYASLKSEIDPAIHDVIASTAFVLGKAVEDFERRFASAHGVKHCIAVGSGTDALHLPLWSLGIGSGDEVITVAHTFIASAEAISLTGARPVFVDIDPVTYTMDPQLLEKAITPRTRAIIPVHLYGQPAAMDEIMRIADKHNLPVIEDACQAHLAAFNERSVGQFGIATAFSFYPGKNLGAYGEAGGILTDSDELATAVRMLRDHGQVRKYHHLKVGHNYRMDGIQGAVLGVKLSHLDAWTEARRRNAARYRQLLNGIGDIVVPQEASGRKHVYHLFVIQTGYRDQLQAFLTEQGIGTGLHYPIPLHLQDAYASLGYSNGDFPVTERVADRGISLPMFAELTDEQIEFVVNAIRSFFAQKDQSASVDEVTAGAQLA